MAPRTLIAQGYDPTRRLVMRREGRDHYDRINWAATSGLVPIGAQHGRGRLMRPKRASSGDQLWKHGL